MVSDTDALFSEASDELQEDIRDNLSAAEDELPNPDDVWEVDGGNVVGVLNQLQSELDVGDAEEAFQEAQKWYLLGTEADAFSEDEGSAFEDRIESIDEALTSIEDVREGMSDLIPQFPEVKAALDSTGEAADDDAVTDDGEVDDSEEAAESEEEDVEEDDDESEESGAAESWDGGSSDDGAES